MGAKLGTSGGPIADINVTPLIDVVLVLLVVFMVITPMLQSGLPVDLPMATTTNTVNDVGQHVVISMNLKGEMYVDMEEVEDGEEDVLIALVTSAMSEKIAAMDAVDTDLRPSILIKADAGLEYGEVRKIVDALSKNRITTVMLAAGKE